MTDEEGEMAGRALLQVISEVHSGTRPEGEAIAAAVLAAIIAGDIPYVRAG